MSHSRAYASARSCVRLATPTSSTCGDSFAPGITFRLMSAVETIPQRTGVSSGTAPCFSISFPSRIVCAMSFDCSRYQVPFSNWIAGYELLAGPLDDRGPRSSASATGP